MDREPGRRPDRRADKGGVEPLVAQRLDQFAGAALLQGKRHQRVRFAEGADQPRHERVERGRAGEAEADPARLRRARCGGSRRRACSTRAEDRPRLGEKGCARLGQLDAARLAAEQLDLELGFERPDLLAERRLLDAEPLGGAGDMAFLGDRDEVAEVAQFHM